MKLFGGVERLDCGLGDGRAATGWLCEVDVDDLRLLLGLSFFQYCPFRSAWLS